MKLVYMAMLQQPSPDGVRRTKAVVVRNTAPQLNDTTLASWFYWFKPGQAGDWHATDKRFVLRFGDVECEVLFRPLDTPQDVARVLSLEVTFVIIDEFVQIPKEIVEALSARCGRYFPDKGGKGATNWGMWGSSNPGTEDNWWFDHLHDQRVVRRWVPVLEDPDARVMQRAMEAGRHEDPEGTKINECYYKQPSAFDDDAENLENLPPYKVGDRSYYNDVVKGKSDDWIKQFVECEWGYSIAGKAVIAGFKPLRHISKSPLRYNHHLPLVAGFDPGLAGSALVFGQQDLHGRLLILGELVQENMGSERIISERLKPFMRRVFPQCQNLIIASDPAGNNRSAGNEQEILRPFKDKYQVVTESNNRLALRVDSLDYFCGFSPATVDSGLLIDEQACPIVIRALKGGWRFAMDTKKDQIRGITPEKNAWSHPGDATGYLARYFRRESDRELRYGAGTANKRFVPPRKWGPAYHQV